MASNDPKLPVFIKFLIGIVILLFGLPFVVTVPAFINATRKGTTSEANELSTWEGQSAPDLEITTIDGATLKLSELRGRAVILDYWATWCGPCILEIPHLQKLADEFPQDLVVVGVSSENISVLQKFARSKSMRYQVGTATNSPSPYADIRVIPTTFFIDRNGTIRKVVRGYHDYPSLKAQVSMIVE